MAQTKADLVAAIADQLGEATPLMSTGSTEPKAILRLVSDTLGLGLDVSQSKPDLAQAICASAGVGWDGSCWSTGSTITAIGLERILEAVTLLTGHKHGWGPASASLTYLPGSVAFTMH